ncbi:MAG: Unknown protein [uncultured Thiotrichaceae bacterium]|uniref:Uncharacterized protein n=1 Tax=uncultured Thiotrichaceae bacterium TaxID=298394 RepID=A0A6S6S9F8_9GAMM|nr:MAG: Unknown protein [uncultured Thiotrichaceae bacterium]
MTLALAALAVIGLLVFLINYGRIIIASFRHHIVTGLISLVPGINIVVLPTIWARIGNAFVISIIGLALALGGWILGGKNTINQLLTPTSTPVANSLPTINSNETTQVNNAKYKELPLPHKTLYQLRYQTINLQQTPVGINQQLRVTLKDGSILEGRLVEPIEQAIIINQRPTLPTLRIKIQDVLKVEQLIKTQS